MLAAADKKNSRKKALKQLFIFRPLLLHWFLRKNIGGPKEFQLYCWSSLIIQHKHDYDADQKSFFLNMYISILTEASNDDLIPNEKYKL